MNPLDKIFKAQTIADIGASNEKGSVGYSLIKNLKGSGYQGVIYAVNPSHKSIQGFDIKRGRWYHNLLYRIKFNLRNTLPFFLMKYE